MPHFEYVALDRDPLAARYCKDEVVAVKFAAEAGSLMSREGLNRFAAGDALVTGSTGDRWSVMRRRFEEKYLPMSGIEMGNDGHYRSKATAVLARQIDEPFTVARRQGGDVLTGNAGDWLMQYAPGDYGLTENARFQLVYRRVTNETDELGERQG
jgi:hypothetical protein